MRKLLSYSTTSKILLSTSQWETPISLQKDFPSHWVLLLQERTPEQTVLINKQQPYFHLDSRSSLPTWQGPCYDVPFSIINILEILYPEIMDNRINSFGRYWKGYWILWCSTNNGHGADISFLIITSYQFWQIADCNARIPYKHPRRIP